MRVAIAAVQQESNTFAPEPAALSAFADDYLLTGTEVRALRGTGSEVGGFLDVLDAARVEVAPVLAAHAVSGGPLTAQAFAALRERLVRGLREAAGVDAVLLALHGAMVAVGEDDASGALLDAVRDAVAERPIAATIDSHANVTARMLDAADILVGYRTYPHVDLDGTGRRAAEHLLGMLAGRLRPAMALAKVPMLVPAEAHRTGEEPMRGLWAEADGRRADGTVVDAALCPVQPWLDLPDVGFSAVVLTDGDPDGAREAAQDLARRAWAQRHAFRVTLLEPRDAIRRALAMEGGPVVLSESADATGAGSPGDSTVVLRAALDVGVRVPLWMTVVDPRAAAACAAAGAGAVVTLPVGAVRGRYSLPVTVRGTVRHVGPTAFTFHAGYTGTAAQMGLAAVLEAGAISLVLTERPVLTTDPALYRAVGLEPALAKIVVVKSAVQFRAAYEPLARAMMLLDSPGHSPPNLRRLSFARRPRPCFPFEDGGAAPVRVHVGRRSRVA